MKYILILILPLISSIKTFSQNDYKVFHTSICYDLLSSMEYSEKLLNTPEFQNLKNDILFINSLDKVNEYVKASNIYLSLNSKMPDTSYNIFLLDLFETKLINSDIEALYTDTMKIINTEK